MKSILTIAAAVLFVFTADAQTPSTGSSGKLRVNWFKDGWIVDAGLGVRTFGRRSEDIDRVPGFAAHGGLGYKFNDTWGVRGRLDYYGHALNSGFGGVNESKAHSLALSALGTVDLVPLITGRKGTTWHFITYLGAGLTTSWNPNMRGFKEFNNPSYEWQDPMLKGHDDMGHIIFGITPQYHLSSRFALTLDISSFFLFAQDFTYDYNTRLDRGTVGAIVNYSFGFVFYPHF